MIPPIKNNKYNEVSASMQKLSETLIQQYLLVEDLLDNGWKDANHKKFLQNENTIDGLEVSLMEKLPELVICFAPRAAELRRIVSCHEVIIFMEEIGDYLLDIVDELRKSDLSSPDYSHFKQSFRQLFEKMKDLSNRAAYSFYSEDTDLARTIISQEKECNIECVVNDISESVVSSFRDIPMETQEVTNILVLNNLLYIVIKMKEKAEHIAKSTIFAVEGIDLRHDPEE